MDAFSFDLSFSNTGVGLEFMFFLLPAKSKFMDEQRKNLRHYTNTDNGTVNACMRVSSVLFQIQFI